MANILVGIEHGIEVAAEDILKFLTSAKELSSKLDPNAIAGLGVLLGTVAKAMEDVSAAAANPLNLSLDATTVQDLKAVWPAVVKFAASIGIKL
jgi:hypothetical protein